MPNPPLTGVPLPARPSCTGSGASGGLPIAKQPSQCLVDRTIIWKGLGDLGIENDYIGDVNDPLSILAANQRPKVGALVLGAQILGYLSASPLHRSSFHLVSPAVH